MFRGISREIIQSTNSDNLNIVLLISHLHLRDVYQDFKDTIDGGATVRAEVVTDVFSARSPFIECLNLALCEFDGASREDDIGGKSTAGFLLTGLAVASSLYINCHPTTGPGENEPSRLGLRRLRTRYHRKDKIRDK
jgi:hypothetical protein